VDYYEAEFLEALRRGPEGEAVVRSVGEWIDACKRRLPGGITSADEVYLALVLESEEVSQAFARSRSEAAGFEHICKAFTDRISHEDKESWDERVGESPTRRDRQNHPAMARAVESGEAEFSLLSEARSYQQSRFFPDPTANRTYARFYLPVREAFEARHGRIVEEYWCNNVALGAVRTTGGTSGSRLHFDGAYDDTVSEVINRCKEVHRKGQQYLPPPEYETLVGEVYGLLTDLFASMDRVATLDTAGNSTYEIDQKPYLERIEGIEMEVEAGMARRGQRWYISATVVGLAFLSVVLAVLAAVSSGHVQRIFEGAIFGAAGALASVLYRMNRGDLPIDAQQGRHLVYVAALVRPITGALFGGIIAALLLSELLPVEVPDGDADRFYFLGVLAFVAGLSERWAPDLLQLTAEQISSKAEPGEDEEEPEAPAAAGTTVSQ